MYILILKDFDSKQKDIKTLESLLEKSASEKQKALIKDELLKIKRGYEAEKQNAYFIDFYLKDSKNIIVLHDLRIEYEGNSAQIDHLLISRFGIELLESKSFSGKVTINNDNSFTVKYSKDVKSAPNPLEQSKRHAKLLSDFINNNFKFDKRIQALGGFPVLSNAVIKKKATEAQANLTAKQRRQNLKDSFAINEVINAQHIAIVDDVMTTGATMNEIAKLLKKAGIKHIEAWVCARTYEKTK